MAGARRFSAGNRRRRKHWMLDERFEGGALLLMATPTEQNFLDYKRAEKKAIQIVAEMKAVRPKGVDRGRVRIAQRQPSRRDHRFDYPRPPQAVVAALCVTTANDVVAGLRAVPSSADRAANRDVADAGSDLRNRHSCI